MHVFQIFVNKIVSTSSVYIFMCVCLIIYDKFLKVESKLLKSRE